MSSSWFHRQVKDKFVKDALKGKFRSRASFKLLEIAEKYKIFKQANLVMDLGASPGGWSQVASQHAHVIAIDLKAMRPIDNVTFVLGDFTSKQIQSNLLSSYGKKANVILSDMCPNVSGIHCQDHLKSMELVRSALIFSRHNLHENGHFVAKILSGKLDKELYDCIKNQFKNVHWVKPEASRMSSSERYIIGIDKV